MTTTPNYLLKEVSLKIHWLDPQAYRVDDGIGNLEVTLLTNRSSRISWKNIPEEYKVSYILIQKSTSPVTGWATVNKWVSGDMQQYEDDFANTTSHRSSMEYYRLVIPELRLILGPVTYEGPIEPYGLEIARRHAIKLKQGKWGNRCFLAIKNRDSARCPDCYDDIMQQRTRTDCPTCDDTGFISSYFNPTEVYLNFGTEGVAMDNQIDGAGNSQDQVQCWTTNFPIMSVGDVVIEAVNRRVWIVSGLQFTTYKRIIVKQMVTLQRSDGDDPEVNLVNRLPKEAVYDGNRSYTYPETGQGFLYPRSPKALY